jgi:hypothetical protein
MPMQRGSQCTRGHRVLDQREPAVRLVAVNHEPDPDASQEPSFAVAGPDDPRCHRRHIVFSIWVDSYVA